jgi:hypothetical protein
MDASLASLIAAGITAIIGPIIVILVQMYLKRAEEKELPTANSDRLSHLSGRWYGKFRQHLHNDLIISDLIADLSYKRNIIKGELRFALSENESAIYDVYNGLFDGYVLKIEYKNAKKHVFQYGSAVMKMNGKGDLLEGHFVGYSPMIGDVVSGRVKLSSSQEFSKTFFSSDQTYKKYLDSQAAPE